MNGAERWGQIFGQFDIVVTHHSHILWHHQPGLIKRLINADGDGIVAGKHRMRWLG
ncbi:hypothetical protein D3C77_612140 [compost metagenome]